LLGARFDESFATLELQFDSKVATELQLVQREELIHEAFPALWLSGFQHSLSESEAVVV